jgi:hypothetical protein
LQEEQLRASQAYLLSQRGHDAVNFGTRTSFIFAPQDGQSKPAGRFTFSTTSGFMREWLKLFRGSIGSINFPICTYQRSAF